MIRYNLNEAPIAQLVERQFCKLDVAGSIPARGSKPLNYLRSNSFISYADVPGFCAYCGGFRGFRLIGQF